MTDLLSCPFCRSTDIDPEGWMSCEPDGSGKKTGPACNECGGSTESVERWNNRPRASFSVEDYVLDYEFRGDGGDHKPTAAEQELLIDAIHGVLWQIEERTLAPAPAQSVQVTPIAWTNKMQLSFLKDPAYAAIQMAMWGKRGSYADIALYPASQPSPAATVETATSSDGGGESRPASTEPQASALRRPQGLIGEAGVAPSPSDSHPSSSAGNAQVRETIECIIQDNCYPDSEGFGISGAAKAADLILALNEPQPVSVNAAMAKFVQWALQEGAWSACDLEGSEIQEQAEELGLIIKTKYDAGIHGENEFDIRPGDDWFVLAPEIASALSRHHQP